MNPAQLRAAARVAGRAQRAVAKTARPLRAYGFPYRKPTVPHGVEVPSDPPKLGADFETEWARSSPARLARTIITEGPLRLAVKGVTSPDVRGADRLEDLRRSGPDGEARAVIFAPNHHSHLDTLLMATVVPHPWRSKLVVAAAADYFFTSRVKGAAAALTLNALPIDRETTGRKSSDQIKELVEDGWSLVIYPEGGRSPDGWGQEWKGGAAYLSARTGAPIVPVFIDGTGAIFGKGMKRLEPGRTTVVFGQPLQAAEGENTRRFSARIAAAVTLLGDEVLTDYWTARRRASTGANPPLTGPEYTGWRRQWTLYEHRKLGAAGKRRRQVRAWPDLG